MKLHLFLKRRKMLVCPRRVRHLRGNTAVGKCSFPGLQGKEESYLELTAEVIYIFNV